MDKKLYHRGGGEVDYTKEAEELYPLHDVFSKDERDAHIKAREMSAKEIDELKRENEMLKTVMIAAAEEIQAHWEAHCDDEGYGPTSLLRRLEHGIAVEYGYTAGRFAELVKEVKELREVLGKLREGLIESGLIFAYLEDSTHGKEGELITEQRGKIKQLLTETQQK